MLLLTEANEDVKAAGQEWLDTLRMRRYKRTCY